MKKGTLMKDYDVYYRQWVVSVQASSPRVAISRGLLRLERDGTIKAGDQCYSVSVRRDRAKERERKQP